MHRCFCLSHIRTPSPPLILSTSLSFSLFLFLNLSLVLFHTHILSLFYFALVYCLPASPTHPLTPPVLLLSLSFYLSLIYSSCNFPKKSLKFLCSASNQKILFFPLLRFVFFACNFAHTSLDCSLCKFLFLIGPVSISIPPSLPPSLPSSLLPPSFLPPLSPASFVLLPGSLLWGVYD